MVLTISLSFPRRVRCVDMPATFGREALTQEVTDSLPFCGIGATAHRALLNQRTTISKFTSFSLFTFWSKKWDLMQLTCSSWPQFAGSMLVSAVVSTKSCRPGAPQVMSAPLMACITTVPSFPVFQEKGRIFSMASSLIHTGPVFTKKEWQEVHGS